MSSIRQAISALKDKSFTQSIEFEKFVVDFIEKYGAILRDGNYNVQFYIFARYEGDNFWRVRLSPKRQLDFYDSTQLITRLELDSIFKVLEREGGLVRTLGEDFWEVTFLFE